MDSHLRIQLEDAGLKEILDRVLEGCITFDPSVRVRLSTLEIAGDGQTVVVAPERRRAPFVVPRRGNVGRRLRD